MRRLAIVLAILAVIAALFGCMPGKHITEGTECYVVPSVNLIAIIALLVVAAGAGLVALVPRRPVAMTWLAGSAFVGLGYIVARLWLVRPGVTVALWPRYVTLSLIALLATTMFGLLIWLVMTDGAE